MRCIFNRINLISIGLHRNSLYVAVQIIFAVLIDFLERILSRNLHDSDVKACFYEKPTKIFFRFEGFPNWNILHTNIILYIPEVTQETCSRTIKSKAVLKFLPTIHLITM